MYGTTASEEPSRVCEGQCRQLCGGRQFFEIDSDMDCGDRNLFQHVSLLATDTIFRAVQLSVIWHVSRPCRRW